MHSNILSGVGRKASSMLHSIFNSNNGIPTSGDISTSDMDGMDDEGDIGDIGPDDDTDPLGTDSDNDTDLNNSSLDDDNNLDEEPVENDYCLGDTTIISNDDTNYAISSSILSKEHYITTWSITAIVMLISFIISALLIYGVTRIGLKAITNTNNDDVSEDDDNGVGDALYIFGVTDIIIVVIEIAFLISAYNYAISLIRNAKSPLLAIHTQDGAILMRAPYNNFLNRFLKNDLQYLDNFASANDDAGGTAKQVEKYFKKNS